MVEDLERLLRKKKKKVEVEIGISLLHRSISFPKEWVISFDDIQFDEKIELSLFRYRLDSKLS